MIRSMEMTLSEYYLLLVIIDIINQIWTARAIITSTRGYSRAWLWYPVSTNNS